jgi:phosphopantothenoylcysteine decarboxylase / phosphopantothenate---cysteine ligase
VPSGSTASGSSTTVFVKILFELCGSIAACKACTVISRLVQDGHEVQTIATETALRFVGPATLEGLTGRPVRSDMWATGTALDHLNLAKWADLVVLCPATAHTLNRLAAGLADDLVGALFLAHDRRKPCLVAPAMNPAMWAHPATQAAVEKLRAWGVQVLPVARGRTACGDEGDGRMLEPEEILDAIRAVLPDADADAGGCVPSRGATADDAGSVTRPTGKKLRVLVTAGGTEEPIDGVRTLSNFSTGQTGAQIAAHFSARGHDVVLLRGLRAAAASASGVRTERFCTVADLEAQLRRWLGNWEFDAVIHAAAVSDYTIAAVQVDGEEVSGVNKLDSGREVTLRLRPTQKLVDHLREWSANPALRVVAFKLTRGADAAAARAAVETLFSHSHADAVVHNDLTALDAASGRFPATLWLPDGRSIAIPDRESLGAELEPLLTS